MENREWMRKIFEEYKKLLLRTKDFEEQLGKVLEEYKKLLFDDQGTRSNSFSNLARELSEKEVIAIVEKILKLPIAPIYRYILIALLFEHKRGVVLTSKRKISKISGKSEKTIERFFKELRKLESIKLKTTPQGTEIDYTPLLGS